jgi:hypothetical protein
MDISGQVLAVTGESKTTQYGQRTVYRIAFSDGQTYDTWKADIATKAQQLQGQQVDIRAETKTNLGKDGVTVFTNLTLLDIAPSGQLLPAASTALGITGPPVGNGATAPLNTGVGAALGIPMVGSGGEQYLRPHRPEVQSQIVKQSCLSTAFNFVGLILSATVADLTVGEATEEALKLAKTLYAEVYGQENVAQTPQAVAAAVNDTISEAVKVGVDTPSW